MSDKLTNTLRGLVLIGLALFLTHTILEGTLLFYISRRFAWLTWVATILLLLMAYAYRRQSQQSTADEPERQHHHHDEQGWIALILVALPLLLGVLLPPQPLGAGAVGARELNASQAGLGDDETVLARAAAERNILDWLRAFYAADDPSAFTGQEATVTGFVYRAESLAADQFMVSRFVITCCVADATAVGLVVSWPDSPALSLDTWVKVRGTFQVTEVDGETTPILVADDVTPTTLPNQPYLYP